MTISRSDNAAFRPECPASESVEKLCSGRAFSLPFFSLVGRRFLPECTRKARLPASACRHGALYNGKPRLKASPAGTIKLSSNEGHGAFTRRGAKSHRANADIGFMKYSYVPYVFGRDAPSSG